MKKKLLAFLIIVAISNLNYAQDWVLNNIDPNTGEEPYEIDSGDIDGDGDMDIVMATYDSTAPFIKCYLNDGSGNFPIEIIVSTTMENVDGLILADVNEDGAFDIIATASTQSKLVYYLSATSMDATYMYTETIIDGAITGPGQVVSGDINNDGHVDLVVAAYDNNRTQWYSGDGSGNFVAQPDVENTILNGPYYVDIADFDADGDLDVLVGYYNDGAIEIYYNQYDGSDPDPATTVSWIKDTQTVDSGANLILAIAFADVNNDGTMDVVKLDYSSGDVEWFNKIKNGTSTANTISDDSIINNPGAMLITDIDEDGLNDFILTDFGAADNAIIWFKGAANASPSTTAQLIIENNYQMQDITAADFDGDSDIDIAIVGNSSDTVDWIDNRLNVLSITNTELTTLSIYPNPASDVLRIEGYNLASINVAVYDAIGKSIIKQTLTHGETLDVSELATGIYTIKINNEVTSKFIKE